MEKQGLFNGYKPNRISLYLLYLYSHRLEELEKVLQDDMMEYKINLGKGQDGNVFNFLMNLVGEYIKQCTFQQATRQDHDKVKDVEWLTQMKSAWIVIQWEGEYNPIHIHTECALSTVLYLKVPEFLPSINSALS